LLSVARKERGQALIEFAFIMPLLLLFILLLVDFGIGLNRRELMQHAVREGARRAAVGDTVAEIQDVTNNQSGGSLQVDDVHVCYRDTNGNFQADAGENVRVWGDYEFKFSADGGGMLAAFGTGLPKIDMSPSAEERLEKPAPITERC